MCGAARELQLFVGRRLDRPQGLWPSRKPGVTTSIFRCRTCQLYYPNPMPLPLHIEQHYNIAPEEYWSGSYFKTDPAYLSAQLRTFATLAGRSPQGCSALDVGAGIGKAMVALAAAGFDVTGLEPSPSFRRAAVERSGIPEDRLLLATVESTSFPGILRLRQSRGRTGTRSRSLGDVAEGGRVAQVGGTRLCGGALVEISLESRRTMALLADRSRFRCQYLPDASAVPSLRIRA